MANIRSWDEQSWSCQQKRALRFYCTSSSIQPWIDSFFGPMISSAEKLWALGEFTMISVWKQHEMPSLTNQWPWAAHNKELTDNEAGIRADRVTNHKDRQTAKQKPGTEFSMLLLLSRDPIPTLSTLSTYRLLPADWLTPPHPPSQLHIKSVRKCPF
jgi:hypothetical protein